MLRTAYLFILRVLHYDMGIRNVDYMHPSKRHTEYVLQKNRKAIERQIANHRIFSKLMHEWIDLVIVRD